MRINLGFKAWSTLSAILLSLVVISGCNDEGTTTSTPATPPAGPGPAAAPKGPGPEMKPEPGTTPPPPTPPKTEEKAPEKK